MYNMCLQTKNITSILYWLGLLNHCWSLLQFGSYPESLQSGRFGAIYFKAAFIKCPLNWLDNVPHVFQLWNVVINIFIFWTFLKSRSTFMVLLINTGSSRLTSLQIVARIVFLVMASLLLLVKSTLLSIFLIPQKSLAHINSNYFTWSSSFCSAFLRQNISHASLFYIISHEKCEALMPWSLPYVICFPDGSSPYLPCIQKFPISQPETHK